MCGCLSHTPALGTWPRADNRTDSPLVHKPTLNPLSYSTPGWILLFLSLKGPAIHPYYCVLSIEVFLPSASSHRFVFLVACYVFLFLCGFCSQCLASGPAVGAGSQPQSFLMGRSCG